MKESGGRLSVIDSLSAGFRVVGWRVDLLVIPLLLDLLLWLLPRFSIAPLFERLSAFYVQAVNQQGMPAEMSDMVKQLSEFMNQQGASSNLLDVLANSLWLHMPSLLAILSPLPGVSFFPIRNPLAALLLFLVLGLLGLLLGVIYLTRLARHLPIGAADKHSVGNAFASNIVQNWLRIVSFLLLTAFTLLVLYIPSSLAISFVLLFAPGLGYFLLFLLSSVSMLFVFYLYFVPIGLVLDNIGLLKAVRQSIQLARNNFWSTLGLLVLTLIITNGIGLLLARLAQWQPVGTFTAVAINAYLGTGLAMALLVFYRTRLLAEAAK
jgi:hypothetical protein